MQFVEVWMEHRLRHFGPRVVAVKNLGIHCQRQIKRKPVACTKTNHHRALGFCDTLLKAYSTELALEDLILEWRSRSLTVLASKGCKGVQSHKDQYYDTLYALAVCWGQRALIRSII